MTRSETRVCKFIFRSFRWFSVTEWSWTYSLFYFFVNMYNEKTKTNNVLDWPGQCQAHWRCKALKYSSHIYDFIYERKPQFCFKTTVDFTFNRCLAVCWTAGKMFSTTSSLYTKLETLFLLLLLPIVIIMILIIIIIIIHLLLDNNFLAFL